MTEFELVRDAMIDVDRRLTGPGGAFETVDEIVLGERMRVLRDRPMSLRDILADGTRFGDRDCMVFSDGTRVTFAELPAQVASVARYLSDVHGVGKGDRVAICAANGHGWIVVMWATVSLGAVVVAMNGWWTEPEMANALELSEPAVIFADDKRGARLQRPFVDLDESLAEMLGHACGEPLPETSIDEDDPAVLIFTSGTTGQPKAACLSNRGLVALVTLSTYVGAREAAIRGLDASSGRPPTRLVVFPLFHVAGLGTALTSVAIGATSVWPLGRFDAGAVIDLTVREGINLWNGTTTHAVRLLDHPDIGRVDPAQLFTIAVGGSATTPQVVRRIEERFPHLAGSTSSGYGSTETGGFVSWTPNSMLTIEVDCVGTILPTVEVRITDDGGGQLHDGHEGDIWVRSPLVMLGYWKNEEANAQAFGPGRWLRTGDYGRIENGVLFLASRRRDLIIRGGENIYPFEIENRLEEHPEIIEAVVVGVDDDVFGQEVKAIVVVPDSSTLDAAAVRAHCAVALASYKVPAYVELRTSPLPRNPTGKVLRRVLTGADSSGFAELDSE